MKEILSQARIFSLVTQPQRFNIDTEYVISKYVIILEYKSKVLLFNTLSREMLVLGMEEFNTLNNNIELRKCLVAKYFLIDKNLDLKKLCDQIRNFARCFNIKNAITKYVVFPTMDCNARCFYCFEHGSNRYPMSEETAYEVADYIIKKSMGNKVSIQWFGGEPLYNSNAIDIITNRLNERNIEFKSTMISNGYLFDEEMVVQAKNYWNLRSVQITLDGTRDVYNKTKNYIYKPNNDAFDRVISNIGTALKHKIKILIRINMSKENKKDLYTLTEYLCNKFKGYERLLSIYVWMLYDNRGSIKRIRSDEERYQLTESLIQLENYIYERGFGLKGGPLKNVKVNMCLADSNNTLIILPNGKLGKCDHYSDEKLIGDIYTDITDTKMVDMWKELRAVVELCDNCPLYPQCIKLKNCPELGTFDCDITEQKRLLVQLHRQMQYAYDKYIQN